MRLRWPGCKTGYTTECSLQLIITILCLTCHGVNTEDADWEDDGISIKRHGSNSVSKWEPGVDVLSEAEAYMTLPPIDLNQTVSIRNSIVLVKDNLTSYHVGDLIKLRIVLYDESGRKRCRGGDNLRVRMYEEEKGAYINGFVNDHKNGKYTVLLPAMWAGQPVVQVDLMYTREEIAYMYRLRRQFPALRIISAYFTNGVDMEITDCNALKGKLESSREVCKLTSRNGEEPWYCQRPRNPELTCENFGDLTRSYTSMRSRIPEVPDNSKSSPDKQFNELIAIGSLNNRAKTKLAGPIEMIVNEGDHVHRDDHPSSLPNCTDYDRASLWKQRPPSGYFINNEWHVTHCTGKTDFTDYSCLRDKIFYFYGDSTLKQWFENMKRRFKCENVGGLPYKEMRSRNFELDLILRYIRHNLPGNVVENGMDTRMVEDIDELADGKEEIFILHIYSHYTYYNHKLYRERIQRLRNSVMRLIHKRPNAKVMIKGPATISKRRDFGIVDYFALVYRQILYEEFSDLRGNVIYLENADMTSAKGEPNIHAPADLVTQMVNNMLMYVCDN